MLPHVRFLHGFGSGPESEKGLALGRSLAGACASFAIPDLEGGDFRAMTFDSMHRNALVSCPADAPVVLVGSSLGGYIAALIAAGRSLPNLRGLVLIAPAFGFTTRWRAGIGEAGLAEWKRNGSRSFFHYARQRDERLGYGFLESCLSLPEAPGDPGVRCAVVQGREDETVDPRIGVRWAQAHPAIELHLVRGDHRLTEPRHGELIAWAARDICATAAA